MVDAVLVRWPHGSGEAVVSGGGRPWGGLWDWLKKPENTTGPKSKPPKQPKGNKPKGNKPLGNGR